MNKCERNYLNPPDSTICEMVMFSINDIKNTNGSQKNKVEK